MISVAVVSTAEIAKNKVIPALQSVDTTSLVAISSRDKSRAEAFVVEHCKDPKCVGQFHTESFGKQQARLFRKASWWNGM
jgi:predicted dehydrogenase